MLTISSECRLRNDMEDIMKHSKNNLTNIELKLHEKEKAIAMLTESDSDNKDAIASLSDQLDRLMVEIDRIKNKK
jgi:hypothetical protein